MQVDQLKPGMPAESPDGLIIDWHDRSICRIDKFSSQDCVVNCLVAWSFIENRGIRLYFPITEQYAQTIALQLSNSWEAACLLARNYVEKFVGEIAAAVEHEQKILAIRYITWPQAFPIDVHICDVDSTMSNLDFSRWNDLIYA